MPVALAIVFIVFPPRKGPFSGFYPFPPVPAPILPARLLPSLCLTASREPSGIFRSVMFFHPASIELSDNGAYYLKGAFSNPPFFSAFNPWRNQMGFFSSFIKPQLPDVVEWDQIDPKLIFWRWPHQEIKKDQSSSSVRDRTQCSFSTARSRACSPRTASTTLTRDYPVPLDPEGLHVRL